MKALVILITGHGSEGIHSASANLKIAEIVARNFSTDIEHVQISELSQEEIILACAGKGLSVPVLSKQEVQEEQIYLTPDDILSWIQHLKTTNAELFAGPSGIIPVKIAISLFEKKSREELVPLGFNRKKLSKQERIKLEFLYKEILFKPFVDPGIVNTLELTPDWKLIRDIREVLSNIKG